MKKIAYYFIALFVLAGVTLSGCKKENEETFDAQKELTTYLVTNNLDLNTILNNFVMGAPADGNVSAKYVIDVRTSEEFAQGHIADAHRVDLKDILTEAAKADKPIMVVCKTGQTATHAVTLLRLSGYDDAVALKWGMSSWNKALDVWTPSIGNIAEGHANWNNEAAPNNLTYESPKFSSTTTIAADILKERVAAVLNEGFLSIMPNSALENPGDYFINNYFSEADYTSFGHIKGAYRINPLLLNDNSMNYLDKDKTIITYCYTGQTSSAITAYLRVLGYNAKSMMFGMNKLNNASAAWGTSPNQWKASMSKELPIVP